MTARLMENKKDSTPKLPPAASPARAQAVAISALERIELLGLKPIPQFYELWYHYFDGDPEIVRAVDNYTGKFDEPTCHKLYKRFLGASARDEAMRKVSDQVQQAISELAGMLTSVKSATSDYGETLGEVSEQIETATSLEDLTSVVSIILEDTKKMVEKNHQLETQLDSSSAQVHELKKNLDSVRKEAFTDGLTGVANRKAFDKTLVDMTEEAAANQLPMTMMMIDIDFFKKFNDAYGHQIGDQVLRLVARTLVENVKGRDFVARYGGEEFSVMLPETPLGGGVKVAEMLRRSVENKEVVNKTTNENLGRITLSIGVSQYRENEGVTELIERADAALYQAKRNGRNRVCAEAGAVVDMPEPGKTARPPQVEQL